MALAAVRAAAAVRNRGGRIATAGAWSFDGRSMRSYQRGGCRLAAVSVSARCFSGRPPPGGGSAHAVLGVRPGAPFEEVQRQFRQQALRLHPDTNPDTPTDVAEENFKRLLQAFERLKWEHEMASGAGARINEEFGADASSHHHHRAHHMSEDEAKRRFKAPFDDALASRVFREFLRNKEAVWERLTAEWDKGRAYDEQLWEDIELRAKEHDIYAAMASDQAAVADMTFDDRVALLGPEPVDGLGPAEWRGVTFWHTTTNDASTGFVPVTRVAVRVDLGDGSRECFEQESWLAGNSRPRLRTIVDEMRPATKFFLEHELRALQQRRPRAGSPGGQDTNFCDAYFYTDADAHKRHRSAAVDAYGVVQVVKHEVARRLAAGAAALARGPKTGASDASS